MLVGGVLFGVGRGAGYANVVRLSGGLVVQIQDDAIQNVLVRLTFFMRPEVDAEYAHVFVLELIL
jgi:hypothetical protein